VDNALHRCHPAGVHRAASTIDDLHARCVLTAATPIAWATAAIAHLPELLVDQAHLEKKAAAAALRFLFRVPQVEALQRALSALAREELLHFERTLRLLAARGIAFGPRQPSSYAEQLKARCARPMPQRLCDELLVAALIEARSHDRMQRLATALTDVDTDAAAFYRDLVEAEGRHRGVYLDIAAAVAGAEHIARRFGELAAHEAVLAAAPGFLARLHGGHGDHA
jgi:tRNA 2-(methylsulfanyl)-N6-isopentenyladenosine37 hydroxylase